MKKSRIEKSLRRKENPELVETIILAKKNNAWIEVAKLLSRQKRKKINVNLKDINKEVEEGMIIVVPGKVLSLGEIKKGAKIAAFSYSKKAEEKIKKANAKIIPLKEEIKLNPEGKGIKIIK